MGFIPDSRLPDERGLDNVTNLVKRQLKAFEDTEVAFCREYERADILSRLCLTTLAREPLGIYWVPGIKLPALGNALVANGGEAKAWASLRDAVEEAELAYGLASNKTIPCLAIQDGPARLLLVTTSEAAEEIADMPLMRMRLGEKTYRAFLLSEYRRAREEYRVPHV